MLADKMNKVFNCKRWIVFKRLELLMIKPVYSANRSVTYNYQHGKKLLRFSSFSCAGSIARRYAVLHLPTENLHAHQVMSNLTAYSNCISPALSVADDMKIDSIENLLEKQWISMSKSEILENFKLLSYYAHQNSEDFNHMKYNGIFDILIEKCSRFNNDELLVFLGHLQLWKNSSLNLNNIWKPLDQTCVNRLPNLTVEQIFLISDYFYKLNVLQFSSFIYHAMRKLKPQEMTPANLVQYAFLMKVKGRVPEVGGKIYEYHIEKNIDNFSVEELGIICMSFFKYQTAIESNKLISKILQKIITNIDNVSDITLASILKILRYSADLNVFGGIDYLLEKLEKQIEKRSLLTVTQIAIAQATLLMDNDDLLQKILEKFLNKIEDARLKDIERLAFVLYAFNCDPKTTNFYTAATQELQSPHRRSEIANFIKPYVYAIMYMLKVNYFPEELVKKVMAPDFINKLCNNDISTLDREYLDMSYCLQIDHPEYEGPQLRKDQLKYLTKKFGVFWKEEAQLKGKRVFHATKLMIDLSHHIKLALNSELAIHVDYPLPYHNKQYIFMCYDPASRSFLPPAEPFQDIPLGEIKYAPKDGKQWVAIVTAAHNILTRNRHQPTGMLAMQLRHLERIGYKTILVTQFEWNRLVSKNKKMKFITHILDDFQSRASK